VRENESTELHGKKFQRHEGNLATIKGTKKGGKTKRPGMGSDLRGLSRRERKKRGDPKGIIQHCLLEWCHATK